MSDYAYIADRAKRANASIAALERVLVDNPSDRASALNLSAMRRLARQAEDAMLSLAEKNSIEVCRYRLVPMLEEQYGLGKVSKSLLEYQNLFSQIFDSFANGSKSNKGFSAEIQRDSSLEFAYTYSGSLGIVLLTKSRRDFFEGSFDTSIEALFQILDISDADNVRDIASSRGKAVVKRVHDWCQANIDGGFSTDVKWKRSDGRHFGHMVDLSHLRRIAEIIDAATDDETETVRVTGMMVAGNITKGSFQIAVPGGDTYSGSFHEDFPHPDTISLGRFYRAEIETRDTYYYSTDRHVRSNRLLSLDGPIDLEG